MADGNGEIRAIIADDEPLARRGIRQLLADHRDVVVVAETRNGPETLIAMRQHAPDLLFLDVQMPDLDGFGVLRAHGPSRMPAVIFVTAFDEFAVRAFDAHALDYLVKPIERARFETALERMRTHLRSSTALRMSDKLSALLAAHERDSAAAASQRLLVPTSAGELVLDVDEIDWIEADDYYAAVHVGGRRHLIRESLASLEQRLDTDQFVRVHRSAIVNTDRIREIRVRSSHQAHVILRNGTSIPVSRRRREQVMAMVRKLRVPSERSGLRNTP